MTRKVLSQKMSSVVLAACTTLSLFSMAPGVHAAVTTNQIVTTVEQAKILSNGTRVSAAINGTEAYVSTYRNARANDNDCKIEAVLVAKTVMDLAPEISRVTVYFYSAANINKRKLVSVTVGDVKAFGGGQLGKDQLLGSLSIKDDEVSDPASRLSAYLQQSESARSRKRIDTIMVGDTLEVTADLDTGMSERDMKYEGLKIAEKALETAGQAAKKVRISFSDPGARGSFRQLEFEASQVRSLDSSLQAALANIQIATINAKIDVQSLSTVDGADKDLRDKALNRLKEFDRNGVGISPFLKPFFNIEQLVSIGSDEQAHAAILKLNTTLDEQAERAKNAKDIKPTKTAKTTPADNCAPVIIGEKNTGNRYGGASAMPDTEILSDPDRALKRQMDELKDPLSPRLPAVYSRIVEVLNGAGRTADAQRFQQALKDIQLRIHK